MLHAKEFCKQGFCSLDSGVSLTEEKIWISWKRSELLTKLEVTHRHFGNAQTHSFRKMSFPGEFYINQTIYLLKIVDHG